MKPNQKKVIFALMIATFLAAIEGTIVSTASAAISSDLQGVSLLSWVFSAYLLTMTVTTPIYGKLSDLYGRRKIFTFGTILFLLGSMLCGLAQSMPQLIFFRALQGLGAGAVLPITSTIVGDLFPYEMRAKILGLFSAIWGVSGIVAPLLGGFLVDYVSWHWIFYINLPFGLLSLTLMWLYLKETVEIKQKKQIDVLGVVTFTVAITSFLLVILLGGTYFPWMSMTMVGLLLLAFCFLVLFFFVESRASDPMLPLHIFRIPTVALANVGGFLISMILIGIAIYLPMWVQGVYGFGAIGAGLALTPLSIGWMIGSNTVGQILLKLGPRKTILIGFFDLFICVTALSFLTPSTPPWVLVTIMFVMGIGFGFSMTTTIVLGQTGMSNQFRGSASAVSNFLRTLGQSVGAAIFGALFNFYILKRLDNQQAIDSVHDMEKILNADVASKLPNTMVTVLRDLLASTVHVVFMFMCLVAFITLFVGLNMPKHHPKE